MNKRSKLIVPSKVNQNINELEETEITAGITVPAEGGWGWVVVFASFMCIFIVDGTFFSFGCIYNDMVDDLKVEATFIALINSIAVALYSILGPVASGLINRFGFRIITMMGSMVLTTAYLCSYFAKDYVTLLFFYGVIAGFGACLVIMPAVIIVGFYFERLRALALAFAGGGSAAGITVMFFVNARLVNLTGWRTATLLHSGLFGIIYFLAMTFRPLLSLTVSTGAEDPTAVTYLPSISTTQAKDRQGGVGITTERMFKTVSNAYFPTAAAVLQEGFITEKGPTQAGPSKGAVSKLKLRPQGVISQKQLKQVQSIVSRAQVKENKETTIEVDWAQLKKPKKTGCCAQLCTWEKHVPEARPMYRDDAFYDGRLENLAEYKKSVMAVDPAARTGLEYQMAVSRAVTVNDLQDQKGLYTTAVRRILATMLDPVLFKRCSFLLLSIAGALMYIGILVPYIFLPDRNKSEGMDPEHCNLFVSVIGFANGVGRLACGSLACKYNPLTLYLIGCIITGISTIAFNFSFDLYYQYTCCVFFGLGVSSVASLRSVVVVQLYGLDKLTNATGILLMFQGFGSLISTPLSSLLKNVFNYTISFYVAGTCVLIGGFFIYPLQKMVTREDEALNNNVTRK